MVRMVENCKGMIIPWENHWKNHLELMIINFRSMHEGIPLFEGVRYNESDSQATITLAIAHL